MSDTTKVKCEGATPSHCFFWIAALNNNNVIPEYDFDNGKHNRLKDIPTEFIMRLSWYPVNKTVAEDALLVFNEKLNIPNTTQIFTINVDLESGERLRTHPTWRNDITFIGEYKMETTYALFKTKKDGTIEGFWIDKDGNVIKE